MNLERLVEPRDKPMEIYGNLWNPMESYGSIGSPDGNRINRKHLSPYGPGQWMRWRWVAPGKGGIHHWCQSFLLNLEALESLEARNCDANFPEKTVLLKVLEELFHRFAQVFLALSGSTYGPKK